MIPASSLSRRIRSERTAQPIIPDLVSLRELKQAAEEFGPRHPLRILLLGEPDQIPREEYYAKLPGWFRLLKVPAD